MTQQSESVLWRIARFFFRTINVLAMFIFSLVVVVIIAAIIFSADDESYQITDNSILVLNPAGTLAESNPPIATPIDFLLPGSAENAEGLIGIRDVVKTIEAATEDERIRAILLRPGDLFGITQTFAESIGDALRRFSENGKKVIAYDHSYQQSQYLLASYADEIVLHPMGGVFVLGYGRVRSYLMGMLEKLGIKVHLFRTGEFKTAADPFIREDMSRQDRQTSNEIIGTLWDAYSRQVADNRSQTDVAALTAYIDDPVHYLAEQQGDLALLALKQGWVDKLMTENAIHEHIDQLASDEESDFVQFYEYFGAIQSDNDDDGFFWEEGDQIGLIVAEGQILDEASDWDDGVIAADALVGLIERARKDKDIKALVVRLNTPGGSALASERIRLALELFQQSGRPVVISMGQVAASGGYWIASTADEIWAAETTLTGSIGVFGLIPTFEGAAKKVGLGADGVKRGVLSAIDLTKSLPKALGRTVDLSIHHIYNQFLQRVANGRKLPRDDVKALAQGRVWMGRAALNNGLIDNIGNLDMAVEAAAALAELSEWHVREFEVEIDWWQGWRRALTGVTAQYSQAGIFGQLKALLDASPVGLLLLDKPGTAYVLCLDCDAYFGQ